VVPQNILDGEAASDCVRNAEMVQAVPKDVLDKHILPQSPVNRLASRRRSRAACFPITDDAGFISMM
jgi:acetoacetyl-CoA reductase